MSKGQSLGFLNFGIDGDDKELKKKLKELKKDSVVIADIFKSIKIDTGGSKLSADTQKARIQADKLLISNEKLVKSIHETGRAEEKLNNERRKGATLEEQRYKILAQKMVEVKRQEEIELNMIHKKMRAQQQAEMHAALLEGRNKRNALIGQKGQQDFKKSIDESNKSLSKQSNTLSSLEKKLVGVFSTYQLARFAKEVINIRGQFQGLELGFETMLGSADKSRKMMADITDMALKTPYSVKEVADNTKQLIAMGIEADKAIDTMKALADVSSGLAVPMWRIAINYGQVQTLGRLQQREIRDFAMAGVPIVEELAKQLGKTKSEITEMVSAGKIGFPMVEKAFMSMAGEGGKFHNMTEKLNSTMLGQMNRLTDQIQLMFNAIGKSNEGIIYSAIGAASTLVENYETVGKTILALASTYGTYKAIVAITNVVLKEQAAINAMVAASNGVFSKSLAYQWLWFERLNKSMLSNPYVLVGTLVVGLAATVWALHDATTTQEKAQKRLNDIMEEAKDKKETLENKTSSLIGIINSETKTIYDQIIAYKELQGLYPKLLQNMDMQTFKSLSATEQQKLLNKAVSDMEVDELASNIKKYETAISELSTRYRDATVEGQKFTHEVDKMAGIDSFFRFQSEDDVRKALNIVLDGFKKQRAEQEKTRKEAEFRNKPEEERKAILEQQLSDLERQRVIVEKQQEEAIKLHGEWVKFNPLFKLLNGQQETILNNIEETRKKLESNPDIKNKSYWEKQKKDAEDAKNQIDSTTKALLDAGRYEGIDKVVVDSYKKNIKDIAEANKNLKVYNDPSKTPRTRKDPELTKLENRIDLLKTAQKEYEKLSKVMSDDEAFKKVSSNPSFTGISQHELTKEGFMKSINDIMEQASKLKPSDAQKKFVASLLTLSSDMELGIVKEFNDAIERELSKYKDKYNLYETLLGITGNEGQARKLVFPDIEGDVISYRQQLKETLDKTEDKDLKKKLEDQLFSLDTSEKEKFLKDMAEMLGKYQTIEDKITKIKSDGIAERQKITDKAQSGEIDNDTAEKAIKASIEKQKMLISKLEDESYKLSPFYEKLFGDIGSYGNRMLNSLIDKTKQLISAARKEGANADGRFKFSMDGANYNWSESDLARTIKQLGVLEKEVRKNNPFLRLAKSIKEYNKVMSDEEASDEDKPEAISQLGENVKSTGEYVQQFSHELSNMFDSLGNEELAETIGLVGDLGASLSSVAGGIMSGNYMQAASGIIKSITSIANFHDKKLDKAIKRSRLEVSKLKNSYSELSRFISRQLGAVTKQQAQAQIDNLKKQQKELRRQQAAEEDKKKKDKQAIEDYKNSISELEDQIRYFYEDLFSEQYKFDFKSIADQLSSALVDAFKNGEDAAVAFDKTVADIINNLATQMITLQVIEPAMKNLRDYLFGNNGVFLDSELSVSDAQGLVQYLSSLKDSISKSKDIWDALNEAAEQAGIDLSSSDATDKGTLSKGIKEITEDTANLLASYINAIRADNFVSREQLIVIAKLSQLNTNTLGNMLAELVAIRENTFNTAHNTEAIANIVTETNNIIKQVTTNGSGRKINI